MSMKDHDIEELKKRLAESEAQSKRLAKEVEVKKITIQLLVVAGYLDKEKLGQATELAGGL